MTKIPILLLALLSLKCNDIPHDPADLIFHNGVIWTADESKPTVEAVAVRSGIIAAVGSTNDILEMTGPETQVIDLEDQFVIPGFIDTHIHMASAARFLEFNIMQTSTQDEFVTRIEEVVERLPDGEWIVGGLWGAYDQWTEGSAGAVSRTPFAPDMRLIEEVTRNHPVFIRKFDNSEFAANQSALQAAGIDPELPAPEDIVYVLDDDGNFTGRLRGDAVLEYFEKVIPPFSHERRRLQTLNALEIVRKNGVTTVSDMSDDEQLEIYRELLASEDLTARIEFRYPLDRWNVLADQGIRSGGGDPWIRLGSLKGHIDGIMGSSTARFFEPYDHDPTNRGRWRRLMVDENGDYAEGRFLKYMIDADRAGLQMSIHAIGDEANRLLMDYLDSLAVHNGERDRRFRLVHAQVVAPEDFERLGRLGIIAEVQPYHLSDDMRWMEERIGYERSRGAYAFRSIRDSGAMLSFGSDWPGTSASEYPINPLLGIYAAVTRQTLSGQPADGWFPDERIDIEDALRAYTVNAAYALFEDETKGSITPGKQADLTVLSRNLLDVSPAEILNAEVVYTVVDGRVVYSTGGARRADS